MIPRNRSLSQATTGMIEPPLVECPRCGAPECYCPMPAIAADDDNYDDQD